MKIHVFIFKDTQNPYAGYDTYYYVFTPENNQNAACDILRKQTGQVFNVFSGLVYEDMLRYLITIKTIETLTLLTIPDFFKTCTSLFNELTFKRYEDVLTLTIPQDRY